MKQNCTLPPVNFRHKVPYKIPEILYVNFRARIKIQQSSMGFKTKQSISNPQFSLILTFLITVSRNHCHIAVNIYLLRCDTVQSGRSPLKNASTLMAEDMDYIKLHRITSQKIVKYFSQHCVNFISNICLLTLQVTPQPRHKHKKLYSQSQVEV